MIDDDPNIAQAIKLAFSGLSGFEVLERMRRVSDVPVLMLRANCTSATAYPKV